MKKIYLSVLFIGCQIKIPLSFVNDLNNVLANISKENKTCYIMGDFNLNLMNHDRHLMTSEFLDLMYSNSFLPLITRPTRITSNTATLIDNIFTNNLVSDAFNGLLFTDISDHLPIFSVYRTNCCNAQKCARLKPNYKILTGPRRTDIMCHVLMTRFCISSLLLTIHAFP